MQKWTKDVMDEIRRDSRQRMKHTESEEINTNNNKIKPLTLVHMQGPLLLYLIIITASLAVFFSEIFIGKLFRHSM